MKGTRKTSGAKQALSVTVVIFTNIIAAFTAAALGEFRM